MNRRRVAFAATSVAVGVAFSLPIDLELLTLDPRVALYPEPGRGRCLIHVGTEGNATAIRGRVAGRPACEQTGGVLRRTLVWQPKCCALYASGKWERGHRRWPDGTGSGSVEGHVEVIEDLEDDTRAGE